MSGSPCLLDSEPVAIPNAAEAIGAHPASLMAIYRKLSFVKDLPFIRRHLDGASERRRRDDGLA